MSHIRLIRHIRLRTWVALILILILSPLAFLAVYGVFGALGGSNANPVAQWSFDEGADNTCPSGADACDASGNSNDGTSGATTAAPAWQSEDKCVSGKCLLFDGSDDTITVANTVAGVQSVTFWVKVMSTSTTQEIIDLNATDYFTSVSGTVTVAGFGTDTIYVDGNSGATTLTANRWHHVAITSTTGFSASAITMGNVSTNFGNEFLDEVKLFTSTLTAAQVKAELAGGAEIFGTSSTGNDFLNEGLAGYWPMDEATWATNCTTKSVLDKSGNDNNGAPCPNASAVALAGGKFGNAGNFDGTNDRVEVADPSSGVLDFGSTSNFTLSAWINRDTLTTDDVIIDKKGSSADSQAGYDLSAWSTGNDGNICLYVGDSSNYWGTCTSTNITTASTWIHVVAVFDRTSNANSTIYINGVANELSEEGAALSSIGASASALALEIGTSGIFGNPFDGKIDDVRIYNRAFSPAEVKALYNWAPGPVGYWKMDENTGTVTNDSSGNSNNCTFSSMPSSPWAQGKFGSALDFQKTGDILSCGSGTTLDDLPMLTAEAWVYPRTSATFGSVVTKALGSSPDDGWLVSLDMANNALLFGADFLSGEMVRTANSVITPNTWQHVAATWTGSATATTVKLYVNGVETTYTTTTNGSGGRVSDANENLSIGNEPQLFDDFDGYIDEVQVYNYARTSQQIIEDMNAGHPTGGSPIGSQVAYWNLDEQNGQTINTSITTVSLTANRGTTSGSESQDFTWKTKEDCKANGCGDFVTDDIITVTNASAIDINENLATGFTISAWINPDTVGETAGQFFNKGASTYCQLSGSSPFTLTCNLDYVTADANVAVTSAVPTGSFTHVALTFNGTANTISIWINGILRGTSSAGTGGLAADTSNLLIGGGSSNNFDGRIDEFQIYSSELTADQVKVIANQGAANNFGTGTDEKSTTYGGPGGNPPIRYYSFDENKDNTCTGGEDVCDRSGNDKDGTFNGNATFASGKYGSAGSFDDNGDYVDMGSDSAPSTIIPYTVSAWIYPTSLTGSGEFYCSDNTTYFCLYTTGNQLFFCGDTGVCTNTASSNTGILALNQWFHILMTYNGTTNYTFYVNGVNQTLDSTSGEGSNTLNIRIGGDGGSAWFGGKVDEVKWYDYVLNNAQIQYDYNRGAPVGWWQFDECTGATANNAGSIGSGINGTLAGTTLPNTGNGTCTDVDTATKWYNGRTGKLNASLDFDGVDDYVNMANIVNLNGATQFSVSLWLYPTNMGTQDGIVDQWVNDGSSSTSNIFAVRSQNVAADETDLFTADGNDEGNNFYQTSNLDLANSQWQNLIIVYDGAQATEVDRVKVYKNGVLVSGSVGGGVIKTSTNTGTSQAFSVGRSLNEGTQNSFDGQIDDVRVYSYALSTDQILKVMQGGSGTGSTANFGPVTGSP